MENENAYIKGFNSGYLMSQHEQELLNKLLKSGNKDNEYVSGLAAGKRQHEIEKLRTKSQEQEKRQSREH